VINKGFINLVELEKIFHMFSNSIDCDILVYNGMIFERVSNFIQRINEYGVENKHDL